jgi:hypothetical protein
MFGTFGFLVHQDLNSSTFQFLINSETVKLPSLNPLNHLKGNVKWVFLVWSPSLLLVLIRNLLKNVFIFVLETQWTQPTATNIGTKFNKGTMHYSKQEPHTNFGTPEFTCGF